MKDVVVADFLIRIQVIPALAALAGGAGIPSERQDLPATVRKVGEVLLQRLYAEGVANLEIFRITIRVSGSHDVTVTITVHTAGDPIVLNLGVIKVANDRFRGSCSHRQLVMRT